MAELKRERFYQGMKRVYRESFVHLYEEKKSFEKILEALLIVERALLELGNRPLKLPEEGDSVHGEDPERKPRHKRNHS